MIRILKFSFLVLLLSIMSCSSDDDSNSNDEVNLEGVWVLSGLTVETAFDFNNVNAMVDFLQWGDSFDFPSGRENVAVTRKNYEIALTKEAVGYAGTTDVYRWESQLALNNIDLNDSYAQLKQSSFNLNQILNRPIKEAFITNDSNDLDNDHFSTDDEEDKSETDSFDSGHGNHFPNSDTNDSDDNGSDDDNPSAEEKSSDSDKDTRPLTKKRKRN